jgi:hypothetical protein
MLGVSPRVVRQEPKGARGACRKSTARELLRNGRTGGKLPETGCALCAVEPATVPAGVVAAEESRGGGA